MYKRSNYPRASFVVSILLICGYNLFVSLTLPSAEQQEIREIMINEAPLVNPGTVLVADQRDVDVDEPAQGDQTDRAALH